MSPFDYHVTLVHPYKKFSKLHQHFEPTDFRNATFSASVVPFKWMLRENIEFYAKEYGIDCSEEYEPDIGFKSSWTQSFHNQTTLLNTFFGHLKPEKSICFFLCKKRTLC